MTNGEIDRLGERIRNSRGNPNPKDIDLLQEYRQSFQEPIARVFSSVLQLARKVDRQAIVTFRIKRIDTIIDKLSRTQNKESGPMQFSRMWDIAGCRCIINTSDSNRLYDLLSSIKEVFGNASKIVDHINPPKEDGYRSLHIYVKDQLSGKRIEIQIRNRKQHNWATLVEIVDLLYGTRYKEYGNNGKLGRFLLLFSDTESLSDNDFSEMLKVEREEKVFERMSDTISANFFEIRKQWLKLKQKGPYYVISANKKGSTIESFYSFKDAENVYYQKYQKEGNESNIVLTYIPGQDFNQISIAYSNYILAMHAFFDDYRRLVSKKIIESITTNNFRTFVKDFSIYSKNIKYYFHNLRAELKSMEGCVKDNDISRAQMNKWMNEVKDRLVDWSNETTRFFDTLFFVTENKPIYRIYLRTRLNRLQRLFYPR